MTGIERLRKIACNYRDLSRNQRYLGVNVLREADLLDNIVDQIERETQPKRDADTIENIRLIVGGVVDEMERHVLGHEGMEDSPVARWARELREALGGDVRDHAADVSVSAYDLLPQEEREAIAWVREHGWLESVKRRWECLSYYADPVPRSCMEKRLARLQRQIDESHAALRRRRETISELNRRACDLTRENAELRKRAMPDGMEWLLEVWPKWSNGEYCKFGDWWTADKYGDYEPKQLRRLAFFTPEQLMEWGQDEGDNFGYEWDFMRPSDTTYRPDKEEPPAPKVLDADGEPCEVGDAVWWTRNLAGSFRIIRIEQDGKCAIRDDDPDEPCGMTVPAGQLTHRAPVLAADGRPLREGEHVYHVETGTELVVKKLPKPGEYQAVVVFALPTSPASHLTSFDPDQLTHQRPVLDADGVEIRVGDTVWNTYGLGPFEVTRIVNADRLRVICDDEENGHLNAYPEMLTHRAPVLAADGKPLREGETVWNVKTGERYVVGAFAGGCVNVSDGRGGGLQLLPSQLTHERPVVDTWERLEGDAEKDPCDYFGFDGEETCGKCPASGKNCEQTMARDLVRRAKKLAGVSE